MKRAHVRLHPIFGRDADRLRPKRAAGSARMHRSTRRRSSRLAPDPAPAPAPGIRLRRRRQAHQAPGPPPRRPTRNNRTEAGLRPLSSRKLLLVDGSSICTAPSTRCRRSAIRRASRPARCSACSTCCNKLIKEEAPQRIAVVFDAPGRTFRDDLFEQYKAHRPPMPDDLRAQIAAAAGGGRRRWACRCCASPGVEADDVIGTLARRGAAAGYAGADLHRRQGHGAAGRTRTSRWSTP